MMSKNTKERILKAALTIFLAKGFSGASISQIAKEADINQSLIYHHFKSKEDLWMCVKSYCVDEATKGIESIRHDSLEHFVHDLVEARFSVYTRESMRMLVHWQALEPNTSQFYGQKLTPHPLFDIALHVKALQKKNLIRSDKDYQVLSGSIFGLSSYAFFDFANAYELSTKRRDAYKQFVCELLIQALKPEGQA